MAIYLDILKTHVDGEEVEYAYSTTVAVPGVFGLTATRARYAWWSRCPVIRTVQIRRVRFER